MESQNAFSQSEGFVNLLTSQIPPDNYSPCTELGSSDFPVFSTQGSDEPTASKVRKQWTPKEDLVLISAWLNTSKDFIVGNEQRAGAFWQRIEVYYNGSDDLIGLPRRGHSQCKQQWGRLNDQVCKFVGAYEAAQKQRTSGQNENDVMKAAHEIFFNDYLIKFTLEHAWRELRHDQKWCTTFNPATKDGEKAKRRKVDDTANSSSSVADDVFVEARPPGVKASKAKAKKSAGGKAQEKEVKDYTSVWEIKQRDLELKDKLIDKRLLEKLVVTGLSGHYIVTGLSGHYIDAYKNWGHCTPII
ncbi:glutathione S-transferase T3-like [Eutrema salsugineum]|uniref:glutathione S-transferase T3-like n=1 Tax=Eutrema salsugineum TaxID=72664 RepID=UPI000CECE773|nr:glutathione S-transferase T3-like [Eutrema salsugineum]